MDDIKMNEAEDSYAKLEEILADFKLWPSAVNTGNKLCQIITGG